MTQTPKTVVQMVVFISVTVFKKKKKGTTMLVFLYKTTENEQDGVEKN